MNSRDKKQLGKLMVYLAFLMTLVVVLACTMKPYKYTPKDRDKADIFWEDWYGIQVIHEP